MTKYAQILNAIKQIQMELTALAVRCTEILSAAEEAAKKEAEVKNV